MEPENFSGCLKYSYEHVKTWLDEIDRYSGDSVARMLVGNKSDMTSCRQVDYDKAKVSGVIRSLLGNLRYSPEWSTLWSYQKYCHRAYTLSRRGYRGVFWVLGPPPPTAVCNIYFYIQTHRC